MSETQDIKMSDLNEEIIKNANIILNIFSKHLKNRDVQLTFTKNKRKKTDIESHIKEENLTSLRCLTYLFNKIRNYRFHFTDLKGYDLDLSMFEESNPRRRELVDPGIIEKIKNRALTIAGTFVHISINGPYKVKLIELFKNEFGMDYNDFDPDIRFVPSMSQEDFDRLPSELKNREGYDFRWREVCMYKIVSDLVYESEKLYCLPRK